MIYKYVPSHHNAMVVLCLSHYVSVCVCVVACRVCLTMVIDHMLYDANGRRRQPKNTCNLCGFAQLISDVARDKTLQAQRDTATFRFESNCTRNCTYYTRIICCCCCCLTRVYMHICLLLFVCTTIFHYIHSCVHPNKTQNMTTHGQPNVKSMMAEGKG